MIYLRQITLRSIAALNDVRLALVIVGAQHLAGIHFSVHRACLHFLDLDHFVSMLGADSERTVLLLRCLFVDLDALTIYELLDTDVELVSRLLEGDFRFLRSLWGVQCVIVRIVVNFGNLAIFQHIFLRQVRIIRFHNIVIVFQSVVELLVVVIRGQVALIVV